MPTLRWFGRRPVTSLAVDADRAGGRRLEAGDHAQRRGLAAAGRAEERDELAALDVEVERSAPRLCVPKVLRTFVDLEKRHARFPLATRRGAACAVCAPRPNRWMRPMQAQVTQEGDDRQRRRLVGAVGADQLQVGTEGRPVEQARHGELADHDGEGQERAATGPPTRTFGRMTRNRMVGQPAPRLSRRLGQRAHVDRAQAGIDGAVHVGQRQRHVAERSAAGRWRARCRSAAANDEVL